MLWTSEECLGPPIVPEFQFTESHTIHLHHASICRQTPEVAFQCGARDGVSETMERFFWFTFSWLCGLLDSIPCSDDFISNNLIARPASYHVTGEGSACDASFPVSMSYLQTSSWPLLSASSCNLSFKKSFNCCGKPELCVCGGWILPGSAAGHWVHYSVMAADCLSRTVEILKMVWV